MTRFLRHPELPGLELRRSTQRGRCYRPHTHDALSIGLIEEGVSELAGAPDGPIALAPGDVVVIPPGWVHACHPRAGRWRYLMLHLDAGAVPSELGPAASTGMAVFRGAEATAVALRDLAEALDVAVPAVAVQRDLTRVFATLEQNPPGQRLRPTRDETLLTLLTPVLDRLRAEPTPPPLAVLAESVGMTRTGLIRSMRQATGLPPLAWRQNARVLRARELLRAGHAPAEAAQALGFHDQSHLHRVFRAHVAATPGDYRG
ncbi:AraC family transcriptional regulator [Brachybacterium squillarum]|uniref:AraC family transcriptional regulator n=1 Tax=Brachybacterium squillarum TaxID=661979 RepID=UPI0002629B72|nr:AraC family transcriptional regulator [Brachybacterium squillarum]